LSKSSTYNYEAVTNSHMNLVSNSILQLDLLIPKKPISLSVDEHSVTPSLYIWMHLCFSGLSEQCYVNGIGYIVQHVKASY